MMGSGKTTVGRMLAEKLQGHKFVDIDELIEQRKNKSINDIFRDEGEAYFRQIESQLTKEFSELSSLIISTGGGIVKNSENIRFLKENSILFYLAASSNSILNRVRVSNDRPLLNTSNPEETIINLLEKRKTLYKTAADYEIDTNSNPPEVIADEIIEIYKKHG